MVFLPSVCKVFNEMHHLSKYLNDLQSKSILKSILCKIYNFISHLLYRDCCQTIKEKWVTGNLQYKNRFNLKLVVDSRYFYNMVKKESTLLSVLIFLHVYSKTPPYLHYVQVHTVDIGQIKLHSRFHCIPNH